MKQDRKKHAKTLGEALEKKYTISTINTST